MSSARITLTKGPAGLGAATLFAARGLLALASISIALTGTCGVASASEGPPRFGWRDDVFPNVSGQGRLRTTWPITKIGKTSGWRVDFTFDSGSTDISPILGYGWSCPFMEARLVRPRAETIKAILPNAEALDFKRVSTALVGPTGWSAVEVGDTLTIAGPEGSSYIFNKDGGLAASTARGETAIFCRDSDGRLTTITLNGRTILTIFYQGSRATALLLAESASTVAEDCGNKGAPLHNFGLHAVILGYCRRPLLVGGRKEGVALFDALSSVVGTDGFSHSCSFAQSDIGSVTATFDSTSYRLVGEKGIVASIGSDQVKFSTRSDGRHVWTRGITEWSYNPLTMVETIKLPGDIERTMTYYQAGIAKGKVHTETVATGKKRTITEYSYDGLGRLKKMTCGNRSSTFSYTEDGRMVATEQTGKVHDE